MGSGMLETLSARESSETSMGEGDQQKIQTSSCVLRADGRRVRLLEAQGWAPGGVGCGGRWTEGPAQHSLYWQGCQ